MVVLSGIHLELRRYTDWSCIGDRCSCLTPLMLLYYCYLSTIHAIMMPPLHVHQIVSVPLSGRSLLLLPTQSP